MAGLFPDSATWSVFWLMGCGAVSRFQAQFKEKKMGQMISLMKNLYNDESGQGLVEYLLIVALVALAATAGMSSAASYINSAFERIGQKLGGYIS
jgi:pilus assembly protein Flp/PilA